jgi:hypothetical protein
MRRAWRDSRAWRQEGKAHLPARELWGRGGKKQSAAGESRQVTAWVTVELKGGRNLDCALWSVPWLVSPWI